MHICNLGTIRQVGRMLQIHNAVVDEVFLINNNTGYLDILYANYEQNEAISESLRLNVTISTVILNSYGYHIFLSDIEEGMLVDSLFSPINVGLTPPQVDADLIVARTYDQPPLSFVIDRIAKVDIDNSFLYTGDPNNTDNQIKFNISNITTIRDKDSNPVPLRSLHPGLLVDVIVAHTNFQNTIIPNEADALHVQVL
ncbi:hypothetical protein [Lacrimispora celerecrescens]|uniref:Uncharacterized protein n=1 Tax=[Clostridium] celerecrescens 18A TaxID=1286362 RepID=A0A2M8Z4S0_9FIRM|nr:hypothetical protein [Lacrimispora celerecrescens]PJJ28432.1 hypothetical protein H171_1935 [[Clostridium] celerecrescens 18A]